MSVIAKFGEDFAHQARDRPAITLRGCLELIPKGTGKAQHNSLVIASRIARGQSPVSGGRRCANTVRPRATQSFQDPVAELPRRLDFVLGQ